MPVRKITGVIKKRKTPIIVIDDNNSGNEDDGYDTDNSDAGMPKMVKRKYDSSDDKSDDKEDDVSPQEEEEEEEEEIKVDAKSGELLPVHLLGRGLQLKEKRTHYEPLSSEFINKNVSNMCSNVGHFQGVDVLNLSYRGQKYHLKEGVVSFNLNEKPEVDAPEQYTNGVLHLNLDHGNQEIG